MARNGRTIILSIHQPRYSIYRLFDSLTLLVHGKQVIYNSACFYFHLTELMWLFDDVLTWIDTDAKY